MAEEPSVSISVLDSVTKIEKDDWNRLANPSSKDEANLEYDYNPFLSWEFFAALERSGSAVRETGWLAQHLVMKEETSNKVIGILPCYLKNHSQGEYVFDHGWADAFERAGGNYYPKLQCTVPFTPATGRRFLVGNDSDSSSRRLMLAGGLQQVCEQLSVSSAHITFMEESECKALSKHEYLQRNDQQFHWLNDNYEDFGSFLDALSSRKRKNIKKERAAALGKNDLTIHYLRGDEITKAVWDTFFQFYMDTGSRKWGQPYLTREFYTQISKSMADDILLIMVKRNGEYIAGAINFVGSHTLYGRHWGCIEDHPFLHFEVCYYQAIEFAIAAGLSRVEAGAQGGHKLARGYMPQITYSAHYITHPDFRDAVKNYLENERRAVARESEMIAKHGPFKGTKKEN